MTETKKQESYDWIDEDGKISCKRETCGHRWEPKSARKPQCCPKCKSYEWDKPSL